VVDDCLGRGVGLVDVFVFAVPWLHVAWATEAWCVGVCTSGFGSLECFGFWSFWEDNFVANILEGVAMQIPVLRRCGRVIFI
jgi:hypothetical protein